MFRRRPFRSMGILLGILLILAQAVAAAASVPGSKPPPMAEGKSDKLQSGPMIGTRSYGPGDRVADPDEEFVADSGYPLDYYLYRIHGPIIFDLPITRYFGPVDGDGHLLHPENIKANNGMVDLTLRVWDVDADYSGDECYPEVDEVSINGLYLGNLSGWDSQWSTVTFSVPVSQLKFPRMVGTQLIPGNNTIRIDIDTMNTDLCWAVGVDWARLVIEGIRPAVLVHGFMSGADTWGPWTQPGGFAEQAGLPVHAFSFANNHGSWIEHLVEEAAQIEVARERFGVEKLNIVGHSKGGIDSRAYLAFLGGDRVPNLVMLGTPNAGSPVADIVKAAGILSPVIGGIASLIGDPALTELTVVYTNQVYNPIVGRNGNTDYYTVAGNWQWLPNGNPLVFGPDDGVVAVSSVQALPYAISLGQTGSFHTAMTSGSVEWGRAWTVIQQSGISGTAAPAGVAKPLSAATDPFAGLNLSQLAWTPPSTGVTTHSLTLEEGAAALIGLFWPGTDTTASLLGPDGAPIPMLPAADAALLGLNGAFVQIDQPQPGAYQLIVEHATDAPHLLMVGAPGSPFSLSADAVEPVVATGAPAVLEAVLSGPAGMIPPATMTAHVESAGAIQAIPLTDDGQGADAAAGDLRYTGTFVADQAGYYPVVVKADTPVPRIAVTGFLAVGGADRLVEVLSHAGQDDNGDGMYEALMVEVGVEAADAGQFLLAAHVQDGAGQTLVQSGALIDLPPGSSSVALQFDGEALGESGFSGDLFLHATLLRSDGLIADMGAPLAVLSGYDSSQFIQAPLRLLPGIQDAGIDLNQNGRFDQLQVTIPLQAEAGQYAFNARLVDANQQEIGWTGGTAYLDGLTNLVMLFDGQEIGQHGVNGPYQVRDFSLYGWDNPHSLNRVSLHTTQPYLYTQFEGAPTLADGLTFLAPLSSGQPVTLPAGQSMPIRFQWVLNGSPVLDESVTIRIRNQHNRLITGYTYGYGISYDPSSGEYLQPFRPADYGFQPGDQVQVQVLFGGRRQGTAIVNLN